MIEADDILLDTTEKREYNVLILGAGASMAYGFPSGWQLRHKILGLPQFKAAKNGVFASRDFGAETQFLDFKEAFKLSQKISIDAFLGTRREFSDIGKRCIAAVLLECEDRTKLFEESVDNSKDHWYQYLINAITSKSWDELDLSRIAVVTFNYDRSLLLYLHTTLVNIYKKDDDEVTEKLRELEIVNVYGSICDKFPTEAGWLPYDGSVTFEKITSAAQQLNVIPEGLTESPTLVRSRKLIRNARGVAFLGFGFDQINVERLSAHRAFHSQLPTPRGTLLRSASGTAKGVTRSELARACSLMSKGEKFHINS